MRAFLRPLSLAGPIAGLALCLVLGLSSSLSCGSTHTDADSAWIQLFNGKNLDGWTIKIKGFEVGDNHLDTFLVEDGVIKVNYDQYQSFNAKFGHLFTEAEYSHYLLRVEYRFLGEQTPGGPGWAFRNSGLMLHGQTAESMGLNQDFPVSIEMQLLGGSGSGQRSTANLCTPGTNVVMDDKLITRHCTNSTSETFHGDDWVTVEVEVRGNEVIRHRMNGEVVLEYQQPQLDPRDADAQKLIHDGLLQLHQGTISLQAESHPLEFRKVELLPLKP